jgi:hypothetical protein
MREKFIMTIRIIDFQSYQDAINKFDKLATQANQEITIDFTDKKDEDIVLRMKKFLEIADGNGNPEWYT